MNNKYWHETDVLDDDDELTIPEKNSKVGGKERKRKWREIEAIKEQRRLRRELTDFEQYSY